ncbi:MAG TPA: AtpZ/AtpI family protein [Bacteroidia bacterium]|nr:AtpZ/AtpI family protein [Bacteroidia bacterium]
MKKPSQPSPKNQLRNTAKYLSMATYMAVIITGGTLAGVWLDKNIVQAGFPVCTLVLSLLSVFGAMWYFIRDFIKK